MKLNPGTQVPRCKFHNRLNISVELVPRTRGKRTKPLSWRWNRGERNARRCLTKDRGLRNLLNSRADEALGS